jgi:signal transduction histidine kinase
VLLIAILALILASIISHWLAKPLHRLAIVTTDVPDKLLDQKAIAWPSSWVTEINSLVDNFKYMAGTLEQKFQEIKSAKEQLEQRVQERTRELSAANRELKAEVAERKRVAEALQQSEALSRAQAQKLEKALSELQHTQTQLIQTEKMSSLGQLVAGVAHEINNPVNFIYGNLIHAKDYTQDLLGLVQIYQQQYPNPPRTIQEEIEIIDLEFLRDDLPKLLDSMQVGAERIHEIVNSLRNFSRLDESEIKEVDIHEGIDNTLMILKNRLKASLLTQGGQHLGIQVIKEYGDLPLVECYAGKLNQVFMNILVNAIDALEELNVKRLNVESGDSNVDNASISLNNRQPVNLQSATPWIRIRTQLVEGDWVTIRIADNGIGITQNLSSKLFDPFFTTKPVGQGTGLGLSISYQIVVERHGGKLECLSNPEQGTEFIIKIPRRQAGLVQCLNSLSQTSSSTFKPSSAST